MNILILSGSPRKGGNTELLVEAFVKGASQKHHVEVVSVHDYKVNPCMGCNACFKSESNSCVQKDDMPLIYEKMAVADMLVIASPVYFYGLSAQLKAVISHQRYIPYQENGSTARRCCQSSRIVRRHPCPISALPELFQVGGCWSCAGSWR